MASVPKPKTRKRRVRQRVTPLSRVALLEQRVFDLEAKTVTLPLAATSAYDALIDENRLLKETFDRTLEVLAATDIGRFVRSWTDLPGVVAKLVQAREECLTLHVITEGQPEVES